MIRLIPARLFSNSANKAAKEGMANNNDATNDTKEIVLTPGEKVVVASRIVMWSSILAFASVCAYYIGKELFPSYVPFGCSCCVVVRACVRACVCVLT